MTAVRSDQRLHTMGIVVTIAVHILVLGGVYAANKFKGGGGKPVVEKELPHIEAGLAIKATTAAGRKTNQTQKTFKTHDKPQDVAVTKHDRPDDKKPDPNDPDPDAWKKNLHHVPDPTSDDQPDQPVPDKGDPNGKDDTTKQGSASGDPRGTKLNATGNPYEGKLVSVLTDHFEAADFPRDQGKLDLDGCFSLNADGTIDLNSLEIRAWSGGGQSNPAFHSAVDRAFRESEKELEQTKSAGQLSAVPAELVDGLVKGKKCLHFTN